jgi:hypothetical protein
MITVILNGYKRGDNLNEQLEALKNQTVKPDEILLWYNNPGDNDLLNYDIGTEIPVAYCNYNFGVWARFYFAMNARNPYVCVFDDDTIPGERWLENCMETMKTNEGLLGSVGLLYPNPLPPQKNEGGIGNLSHFPRMNWNDWMVEVSKFKYGVHLMPTVAAGTFSLNCAYFGIPVIGNEKVDTQRLLHPNLSVDVSDIESAMLMVEMLKDPIFYKKKSEEARDNYNKYYTKEIWLNQMMNKI